MAFLCLLAMLPTPPKRGIKRPKTTPQIRSSDFFVDFQVRYSSKMLTASLHACIGHLLCLLIIIILIVIVIITWSCPHEMESISGQQLLLLGIGWWNQS